MMLPAFLVLLLVSQAFAAAAVGAADTFQCEPACAEGQCCTRVEMAMASRRRRAVADALLPYQPLYVNICQNIRQAGERCLLNNARQEWCDCAAGLSCTPQDDVALNNFFGVCQ